LLHLLSKSLRREVPGFEVNTHSPGAARVASERSAGVLSLDATEARQFVGIDINLLTKAHFPSGTAQERNTVRVQGLVDRGGTGLGTFERDGPTLSSGKLLACLAFAAFMEGLDDGSLHAELDEVERQEPDDVPDPDNTDPSTFNGVNLGEAPIGECSDDTGNNLGNDESTHEGIRRPLHEEESVGTGDEDQSLGDDGDLEVDDRVDLGVIGILRFAEPRSKAGAELVLEEVGVHDGQHETDGGHGEV